MSARHIVLLRHGNTDWNSSNRIQGQLDIGLNDLGRSQAAQAAQTLAGVGFDAIISSDLSRAADTAAAVGQRTGLPVTTDAGLRELSFGRWEGRSHPEIKAAEPELFAAWRRGETVVVGESQQQVAERAVAAVLEPDVETLLVVTHGGTARAVIGALLELPVESWRAHGALGNCRWSQLRTAERGWRLIAHNNGVD